MNLTGLLTSNMALTAGELSYIDRAHLFVANSLKAVIKEFFMKTTSSIVIVFSCRRKSSLYFFENILLYLYSIMLNINFELVYIDHKNPQHVVGPRVYNLLFVDSLEAFLDIDVIYFGRIYNSMEYYHIFLMQQDQYMQHDMKSIFDYCWTNEQINCNIQYQNANAEMFLYTYFPFSNNICNNTEPQHIDTFIGDSWINKTYFHAKLDNFHGCPLVAVVRDAPPFSFITTESNGTVSFHGVEVLMLKTLAKKINFTLHLRTKTADEHAVHCDSTVLKMLSDRTADIAFGYYRQIPGQDSHWSATSPYIQTKIVAIIYLPVHRLNEYKLWLHPFANNVWYGICLSVTIMLVVTRFMREHRTQPISLISMIACGLGVPVEIRPQKPHSMLIFVTWLWSTYIIRIIYAEFLFHLLRYLLYEFIPQSLIQAIDNNFYAVMSQYTYSDIQSISIFHNTLNRTSIVLPTANELAILSYLEKSNIIDVFAVINIDIFEHSTGKNRKRGEFYVIPDTVIQQQLCLYTAKNSYLTHHFDWQIMLIRSTGLLKFWLQKYSDCNFFIIEEVYQEGLFEQKDFVIIYVVGCVLYSIAFIIFLIEILSRKVKLFARLFN